MFLLKQCVSSDWIASRVRSPYHIVIEAKSCRE